MAITGVASSGIMSGIDATSLVSKILELERRPITLLKIRQNDYDLKISSVQTLSSKLKAYKTSLEALSSSEKFNTKTASVTKTSGGTELLSVSASSDAEQGNYSINVNQLATSSKWASQGWVDSNTTAINSSGGTFKFKVGNSGATTSISVSSTMTLQGLRDAINTASSDVSASIINDGTGSNPYRLILTSKETGSTNDIIITHDTTAGNLGFTSATGTPKLVEAAYAYTENTYAGTVASNSGDNYTGTTNKTFLVETVTAGTPASGSAEYKYSIDGGITWLGDGGAAYDGTNGISVAADDTLQNIDGLADGSTTTEGAKIKFTSGTLAVGDTFSIDVFNPEMQEAKDAIIEIDNATIVKSSNEITDAIQGVTMNLLDADASSTLTLTVSASSTSAREAIEDFVEKYNDLSKFMNEQLSYDEDTEEASPLLGDPTLLEIKRKLTNSISGTIPGLSSDSYTNLSQIGITSDYNTGELSIESMKLTTALKDDADAVAQLFIGTTTPTNAAITYEGKTSDTQSGTYSVSISTAPEQAVLIGDNDLSATGLGSDETLIFKYSENYTETDATTTAFSVTLTAGSTINTIVTELNSAFATNEANFTASNDGGKLKVISDEYGEDIWFKITTDQGHATDQIWDASGANEDDGVDIVGSINNHKAIGSGNILTAASGFAESGLSISTTSNQTGLFGTLTVSLGITDMLPSIIESYTKSTSGVLKSKENSMETSIDDIESRIEILEKRISDKEKRLMSEFSRLEVLMAQFDTLSQYVTNTLSTLPKMGEFMKK